MSGYARTLGAILTEIYGLFVEDGPLAAAILAWVAFAALALPRLDVARAWGGPILFAGLAVILIAGSLRGARR